MSVSTIDHKRLAENFVRALETRDRQLFASLVTDDFVDDWLQSHERVRGVDNYWAIGEQYPGGVPEQVDEAIDLRPSAAVKLVAPSYTLVSVEGAGNSGTATMKVVYADGTVWWAIALYRLRNGRIAQMTTFYAPEYPAPDWRAQWVERT